MASQIDGLSSLLASACSGWNKLWLRYSTYHPRYGSPLGNFFLTISISVVFFGAVAWLSSKTYQRRSKFTFLAALFGAASAIIGDGAHGYFGVIDYPEVTPKSIFEFGVHTRLPVTNQPVWVVVLFAVGFGIAHIGFPCMLAKVSSVFAPHNYLDDGTQSCSVSGAHTQCIFFLASYLLSGVLYGAGFGNSCICWSVGILFFVQWILRGSHFVLLLIAFATGAFGVWFESSLSKFSGWFVYTDPTCSCGVAGWVFWLWAAAALAVGSMSVAHKSITDKLEARDEEE